LKDLCKIKDFGNIDAQLDNLLDVCFEEHTAYKDFLLFKKFLILGKKGSGKTAIYEKVLKIKQNNVFSDGYNLRSYPWSYHNLQSNNLLNDEEKYVNSWEYLILMSLSKLIINKDKSTEYDKDFIESRDILKKFIIDTYGTLDFEFSNLFQPKYKMKFKPFLGFKLFDKEIGIQLPLESEISNLPNIIDDVNKNILYHVLRCANSNNKYYICFDELDFGFNTETNYSNQIIGLIRAAYNIKIKAMTKNLKINVGIFLRDDIYSILNFEDKRKITQNFACKVEWDSIGSITLKQLMENRFTEVLRDKKNNKIKWDDVFDESKRINGQLSKYDYMKELTCLRPRDIIDLCNCVLIQYKKNNRKDNIFRNEDITDAKNMYSNNLYDEFCDEIFKHLGDFKIYFKIIKDIGKNKFSYEEFQESYGKFSKEMNDKINCVDLLNRLFEFSIVGNYRVGGKSGGSKKIFKYIDSMENLSISDKIIVHAGLLQHLDLKGK